MDLISFYIMTKFIMTNTANMMHTKVRITYTFSKHIFSNIPCAQLNGMLDLAWTTHRGQLVVHFWYTHIDKRNYGLITYQQQHPLLT